MFDHKLVAELVEARVVELFSIVGEASDFLLCYLCESFGLNPLGKVVSRDYGVVCLTYACRERSDQIKAPLHKRPMVGDWSK